MHTATHTRTYTSMLTRIHGHTLFRPRCVFQANRIAVAVATASALPWGVAAHGHHGTRAIGIAAHGHHRALLWSVAVHKGASALPWGVAAHHHARVVTTKAYV